MRRTPLSAGCADLPQIDLVIRNVVIVSALGDAPDHPFAVDRELRKVFVRPPPRVVHEPQLVVGKLLRGFAADELRFVYYPGGGGLTNTFRSSSDRRRIFIAQRGHDHDISDYEIYLWEVGTPRGKRRAPTSHR